MQVPRVLFSAIAISLLTAQGVLAQTIKGHLVDQVSEQPIAAGFVVLLNDSSQEVGRALTDGGGNFEISAPGPGRYSLRSAVIGIRSTVTPFFELTTDQDIQIQFAIRALIVTLPTVIVEDERTCEGPPEAGMAAATLWEEARKALDAVAWTERQGMLRHELVVYERDLDPNTLEITGSRSWTLSDVYRGSPWLTITSDSAITADSLAASGYIRRSQDGGYAYTGPDANVLLSDMFARFHCFGIREGQDDRTGFVGLAFEPVLGRSVPEVTGVLWLDQRTAALRFLDYQYVNNPVGIESEKIGGRVEFERLPTGAWIVRRWWIRMPIVGTRQRGFSDFMSESYLKTIEEDGGWVSEVRTLDGELIERAGVATLTGSVLNLRRAAPLPNARIVLVGTGYETYTDQNGQFRFDDIPEGTYRISYGGEILDALGFVPPLVEVTLALDQPQAVTMVIPSLQQLWSDLCPRSDPNQGGIVSGFVRDSVSMEPISGAQVLIYRSGSGTGPGGDPRVQTEVMTNWAGYFRICDLPGGEAWTVEVRRADEFGVAVRSVDVTVGVGDIMRTDFAVPTGG
jgi:hypothetical protein